VSRKVLKEKGQSQADMTMIRDDQQKAPGKEIVRLHSGVSRLLLLDTMSAPRVMTEILAEIAHRHQNPDLQETRAETDQLAGIDVTEHLNEEAAIEDETCHLSVAPLRENDHQEIVHPIAIVDATGRTETDENVPHQERNQGSRATRASDQQAGQSHQFKRRLLATKANLRETTIDDLKTTAGER
jgi:hypothetical protein